LASGEPKGSEQVHEASPLQDGRSTPAEGSPEGGLNGDHRFKGYISVSASGPGTQVLSTVHVGMPAIPISVCSIWALHSPSSNYEDNETGDSSAAATRNSGHHISGRYVADGSEERRFVSKHPSSDHPVTLTGVHHKLEQIFPGTLTTDSLFGIHDSADDNVSAKEEGEEHRKVLSSSFEARSCQAVLKQETVTGRDLSRALGRMTAASQAVLLAPLCYSNLQQVRNLAYARAQSYEEVVALDTRAKEELQWWNQFMENWNGKAILASKPQLTIKSDASLLGWGAHCGRVSTRGLWSPEERCRHINCLELMGVSLAVKAFAKDRENLNIRLCMDNTTVIAYVN